MQNFRQSPIVFEKPGSLSEKLKTLTSWNLGHISYLPMSTKGCSGFFLVSFRFWVIKKTGFCDYVETRSFSIFVNNSRSKQNKKNPEHPFVDIGKWETCTKF